MNKNRKGSLSKYDWFLISWDLGFLPHRHFWVEDENKTAGCLDPVNYQRCIICGKEQDDFEKWKKTKVKEWWYV